MVGNTTSRWCLAGPILVALAAPFGCAASPQPPDDDRWVDEAHRDSSDAAEPPQPRDAKVAEPAEPPPPKSARDAAEPEPASPDAATDPGPNEEDAAAPDDDAGRGDGGRMAMELRDASSGEPSALPDASTPANDAGSAPPRAPDASTLPAGSCRQASDCSQPCVPIGLFRCCRPSGTCGCTWAPGAYCS